MHSIVLFRDLLAAARSLRRAPGFTLAAAGLLTLGTTATLSILAMVSSTLLQPLPFPDGDRLVMVWSEIPAQEIREQRSALANLSDWASACPSIEEMAAFDPVSATLTGAGIPRRLSGARVTPSFFSVLGVTPALGRAFDDADAARRNAVAVVSHSFWSSHFDASPAVVGRSVLLDGRSVEIIGVLPPEFDFPRPGTAFWEPHSAASDWPDAMQARGTDSWFAVARLSPSADLRQVRTELAAASAALEQQFPDANRGLRASVLPLRTHLTGRDTRPALLLLTAAALLLLLIVCSNVAALLMARGAARSRETAVRMALGAGRWAVIRLVLAECGLLSIIAVTVGLALSVAVAPTLAATAGFGAVSEGGGVLVVVTALLLTVAITLVFGSLPALRMSRADPATGLRSGRGVAGRRGDFRLRALLVAGQIALAVVLVTASGLMLRSAERLLRVEPGFDTGVLLAQLALPRGVEAGDRIRFYRDLERQLAAMPGVSSVGFVEDLFIGSGVETRVRVEGSPPDSRLHRLAVDGVSPGLFDTLGTTLLRGRAFHPGDGEGAPVVIINRAMADRFFGDESPVGRRLQIGANPEGPWSTVVGVVADMRRETLTLEPIPQIFEPLAQRPPRGANLVLRVRRPGPDFIERIREAVSSVDARVPVYGATTVGEALSDRHGDRMARTALFTIFGLTALALAAGGIYALLHYSVVQRRGELAIRAALGAESRQLRGLVVADTLRLLAGGVVAGLAAALLTSRAISQLLFEVSPADPLTLVLAIAAIVIAAAAAAAGPTGRAATTDPIDALRSE